MTGYTFDSRIALGPKLSEYASEVVKNEPMFFNADATFAYEEGGPITREFVLRLIKSSKIGASDWVIDTKVAMLMPGWYPCIPGFHHDDVPRERSDKQPEYDDPSYRSRHVMALVGDPICQTEFAIGEAQFPRIPEGEVLYKEWHPMVRSYLETGQLVSWAAPMNRLIAFDDRTWHQGVAATGFGWRWFARASTSTKRLELVTNEIRNQVQVYLEHPMEGW